MEFLCYGTQQLGFQARVILDLWGMVFHAMVAFCLEVDFLLNSISTCCGLVDVLECVCTVLYSTDLNRRIEIFLVKTSLALLDGACSRKS